MVIRRYPWRRSSSATVDSCSSKSAATAAPCSTSRPAISSGTRRCARAAIRETLEETGWTFEPHALVGIYLWQTPAPGKTFLRVTFCGRPAAPMPRGPPRPGILRARGSPVKIRSAPPAICGARWCYAVSTTTSPVRGTRCPGCSSRQPEAPPLIAAHAAPPVGTSRIAPAPK